MNRTETENKRDYFRMSMDCTLNFSHIGSPEVYAGRCKNLSGQGILFTVDEVVAVGTELDIKIASDRATVAPLEVRIEVLRVEVTEDNKGYNIAGRILLSDA
ncbi:MAG: PilZ domain-containing protein [Gammaproteobacteria bacterium]|nr:PilZ domain-containing protein [Gammaproteobacteria bacterium]